MEKKKMKSVLFQEGTDNSSTAIDLGIVLLKQKYSRISHSKAILHYAWIKHANCQTVLYWCAECDQYSFNAQMIICLEIKHKKSWVGNDIPFADSYSSQGCK
jgi:hypothetical protein